MKKNSLNKKYKFSDILIVGLKHNEQMDVDDLISLNFSILDHYNPRQSEIPSYLENINMMCFVPPVNLYSSSMVPLSNHRPNDNFKSQHTKDISQRDCIHQFVLTDSSGDKRYCTSLIIYEKIKVFKSSEQFLPYEQQMEEVYVPYSFILVSSNNCIFSEQNIMLAMYKGWLNSKYRNDCIMSNMKKAVNPSTSQLFEFFISVVFSLPQQIEFTKPVKIIITLEQKQQQEGKKKKDVEKLQLSQYFPGIKDTLFNFPETDFQYLFNRLSISNILKVLHSILLEKQIILFTENVWELTSICEALLNLIQPFQWRCLYIPYLPNNMMETLHATVPFLIGVNTNVRKKMMSEVQDKICVFLDEDRIVGLNNSQIFTQSLLEYITKNCEQNGIDILKKEKVKMTNVQMAQLYRFQHLIRKLYIQMTNNYLQYFIFQENFKKAQNTNDIFQLSHYHSNFSLQEQEFYHEFHQTMIFMKFIEDSHKILYKTDFLKIQCNTSSLLSYIDQIKSLRQKQFFSLNDLQLNQQLDTYFNDNFNYFNEMCKEFTIIDISELYSNYQKTSRTIKYPIQTFDKNNIQLFEIIINNLCRKSQNLSNSKDLQNNRRKLKFLSNNKSLPNAIQIVKGPVIVPPIANEEKKNIDLRNFQILSIGDDHCLNTTREREGKIKTDIFKEICESSRRGKKFIYRSPKINNSRSSSARLLRPFFQSTLVQTPRKKETYEKSSWYDELKEKRQQSRFCNKMQDHQITTKSINLFDVSVLQESSRTPMTCPNKDIILKNPFVQAVGKQSQYLQPHVLQSQALQTESNKKIFSKQSYSPMVYSSVQNTYLTVMR